MLNQPFFQVTLPIMVTFVITIWATNWTQNKRFEDFREGLYKYMDVKFKSLEDRLDKIEKRLDKVEDKLTKIEEVRLIK